MQKKIDLSVVVACYNEIEHIHESIPKLIEFLEEMKINYEIIMIDDCSNDGTRDYLPELSKKFPKIKLLMHEKNVGRGGTVTEGMKLSKGKFTGFLDIDLETPPWYILPAYHYLNKGYDVVNAHRIHKLDLRIIMRTILSRGYVFLVKSILGIPFEDTEAGFKFFNTKKIIPVLEEIRDKKWFFDTEVIVRSYYKNYKIKILPTLFLRRIDKTSTVKVFSDSLDYFKKILKFRKEAKKLRKEWEILKRIN